MKYDFRWPYHESIFGIPKYSPSAYNCTFSQALGRNAQLCLPTFICRSTDRKFYFQFATTHKKRTDMQKAQTYQ